MSSIIFAVVDAISNRNMLFSVTDNIPFCET